jgi:cobalamin biosynthesis protein CbiG
MNPHNGPEKLAEWEIELLYGERADSLRDKINARISRLLSSNNILKERIGDLVSSGSSSEDRRIKDLVESIQLNRKLINELSSL